MANIQIPEELFVRCYQYFAGADQSDTNADRIKSMLEAKLDAAIRRSYYSDMHSKTLSPDERERARQAYLDAVGITDDFRK